MAEVANPTSCVSQVNELIQEVRGNCICECMQLVELVDGDTFDNVTNVSL